MPTYTPPATVADNARMALEVRAEKPPSQRGMTSIGIARASQLANRRPVSIETIERMVAYFDRHEVDKDGATWSEQGKGWQAWMGWGGDEGRAWANQILQEYEMSETKSVRDVEVAFMTKDSIFYLKDDDGEYYIANDNMGDFLRTLLSLMGYSNADMAAELKSNIKASRRHSEADMKILRSMRDRTKAYHDDMMKMYIDMGDDGFVYSDSATDMQAQATAVQPVPPSLKAMPETTAEVLMLIHAWQMQLWYTACASYYNCADQAACCAALDEVKECAGAHRYDVNQVMAQRGILIPATLNEICMMVPEASITPTTNDGMIILENVNTLNDTLIEVLRSAIPVVIAEQQYDIQLMLADLLKDYNGLSFTLARAMAGVYDEDEDEQESEPAESDTGEDMADEYATRAEADRDTTPKEREEMPAGDFVIPETRNFPVVTPDDIPAAVSSWGRYQGNVTFDEFKARLIALAQRKGRAFVDALPQAWRDEMAQRVARALIRY
jgi:hypothetical protein